MISIFGHYFNGMPDLQGWNGFRSQAYLLFFLCQPKSSLLNSKAWTQLWDGGLLVDSTFSFWLFCHRATKTQTNPLLTRLPVCYKRFNPRAATWKRCARYGARVRYRPCFLGASLYRQSPPIYQPGGSLDLVLWGFQGSCIRQAWLIKSVTPGNWTQPPAPVPSPEEGWRRREGRGELEQKVPLSNHMVPLATSPQPSGHQVVFRKIPH